MSNKIVLKAIKALKEKGLVEIVEEHRFPFKSKLRLIDLVGRLLYSWPRWRGLCRALKDTQSW
ncbi:MAG: hypothetical protein DRN04_15380 [Thermoprotei archaeon]|nr:MAG: hypothetical protein DRN04_15380 [Thermoprotei archaeon]